MIDFVSAATCAPSSIERFPRALTIIRSCRSSGKIPAKSGRIFPSAENSTNSRNCGLSSVCGPWIDVKRDALAQFRSQLRYTDVVGKCLAGAYARTVNVELRGYGEPED